MPAFSISNTEALEAGLSTMVDGTGQFQDPDNAVVIAEREAQALGLPQTDREGRAIISWSQYKELGQLNADMSRYALRVYHLSPRVNGTWTVQASKLQKWWGLDYRPVGWAKEQAGKAPAKPTVAREVQTAEPEVTIFFCKDKYPDCGRFFDTKRGLAFHWQKDHGDKSANKKAAVRDGGDVAGAAAPVSQDIEDEVEDSFPASPEEE